MTSIGFVKGHYERPLHGQPRGGGRVTELMARPLLNALFPLLARDRGATLALFELGKNQPGS